MVGDVFSNTLVSPAGGLLLYKLREAEVLISQGATIAQITKKIGVSEYTYYRWRKEYGDMRVD